MYVINMNLRSAAKYTSCPSVFLTLYLFSVSHPVMTVIIIKEKSGRGVGRGGGREGGRKGGRQRMECSGRIKFKLKNKESSE